MASWQMRAICGRMWGERAGGRSGVQRESQQALQLCKSSKKQQQINIHTYVCTTRVRAKRGRVTAAAAAVSSFYRNAFVFVVIEGLMRQKTNKTTTKTDTFVFFCYTHVHTCIYVYTYVYVCACVCCCFLTMKCVLICCACKKLSAARWLGDSRNDGSMRGGVDLKRGWRSRGVALCRSSIWRRCDGGC